MGLATARQARAEGADVVLVGRDPQRLADAADEVGAVGSAAFDAADSDRLERFFDDLPGPVDHVLCTAGKPYYAPLAEMDFEQARRSLDDHLWLMFHLARLAAGNLIAAGFVDTPLSASLLGEQLDARRHELRATLPIGRVVGADDVARLAVHLMTNTALTGATYDVDGGQQLV